uniref:WRC domain-containing protein n=1 Tax=Rhizophora mucronata TaxID=61149 RepID=A0A2P2N7A5_RHIMU
MEGSRCSRVNGRGWRCCQQTLVGYSLCEHHLGKGRLRSMNSVRSRTMATSCNAAKGSKSSPPLSSPQFSIGVKGSTKQTLYDSKVDGEVIEEAEEKKPLMAAANKKIKLGTIKARSMSSLLGQADNSMAAAENNK